MTHHRPRDPQSLRGRVESLVGEHGPCTVDDIAPLVPDATRSQVRQTMCDLGKEGRLAVSAMGAWLGRGSGRRPATYDLPGRRSETPKINRQRVASVWDLGRA